MLRRFDHNARHHLGGEHAHDRQQIAGPVILQQQREKHRRNAEHHHQPAPGRQHKLYRPQRLFIDAARVAEVAATAEENHQADKHADSRQRKADMPAVPLRRQPAGDRRGDGADVTGGVQQRKTAVAARVVNGVELAQQAADVGFEQAVAADNDRQREVQAPGGIGFHAQHHVAKRH